VRQPGIEISSVGFSKFVGELNEGVPDKSDSKAFFRSSMMSKAVEVQFF
jgi:hypothetical protein